jgi:hypothetical protein
MEIVAGDKFVIRSVSDDNSPPLATQFTNSRCNESKSTDKS